MKLVRWTLVFGMFAALLIGAPTAHGQATRTWVSGVGDDANPCSRTAPCKTFAGAISKTAAGGEINVLDPGGFGGVTITKSITIDAVGQQGGVLVSGTNAIVINAAATDRVFLRGLDIEGLGTGLNGIRVLSAGSVYVQNTVIRRFTQSGIDFEPTAGNTRLTVTNTTITDNTNFGVLLKPAAGGSARADLNDVYLRRNGVGLQTETNAVATLNASNVAHNVKIGLNALGTGGLSEITAERCMITENGFTSPAGNNSGIMSNGANAKVRISDNTITDNQVGLATAAGGQIISFGGNVVTANPEFGAPVNGAPTSTQATV